MEMAIQTDGTVEPVITPKPKKDATFSPEVRDQAEFDRLSIILDDIAKAAKAKGSQSLTQAAIASA